MNSLNIASDAEHSSTQAGHLGMPKAAGRPDAHPLDPFAGKALITTREGVKAGLGSRSKIQALIRDNLIATIKVGRSRLIVVESLRAMIQNGGV